MMWIFLLSDTFIFSIFLTGYMNVRMSQTDNWPNPSEVFALEIAGHHLPLILTRCTKSLPSASLQQMTVMTQWQVHRKRGFFVFVAHVFVLFCSPRVLPLAYCSSVVDINGTFLDLFVNSFLVWVYLTVVNELLQIMGICSCLDHMHGRWHDQSDIFWKQPELYIKCFFGGVETKLNLWLNTNIVCTKIQ